MASVVSDSEWPYGQQSTRLLHPQDSPGKNIGVGCHFVLHIRKYKNVWQLQKPNQKSCVACTQGKWRKTVWKPWMPCFSMWTLFPQPTERQQRLFLNKGNGVLCAPEQWHDPATLGLGNTQSLNHVRLFATPQTAACQAPLSMGILQARILEWVAMPSTQGLKPGLPHCRWILYHLSHQGSWRMRGYERTPCCLDFCKDKCHIMNERCWH